MKTTKENISQFIDWARGMEKKAGELCIELLNEIEGQSLSFDWEENDAPSYPSGQFSDDITDAYITRVYLEDGSLYVDLHAYYLSEDLFHVNLAEDCCNEVYVDLLEYINNSRVAETK